MVKDIGTFVRKLRKENELRQEDLALYAGVSTKFIVELEGGKETLMANKINDVLAIFGYRLGAVKVTEE